MFCGKCGKEIEDGSLFCKHCGFKTENAAEAPVIQQREPAQASKPVKPPVDKGSRRWTRGIILTTLLLFVFEAVYGVLVIHSNYSSMGWPNGYSFDQYFGDRLLTYIFGYLLMPVLLMLVFIIPTKKAAWITSIPLFLSGAFSFFSYVVTLALERHINAVSTLFSALMILALAFAYLKSTKSKTKGMAIVLVFLTVLRIGGQILFKVFEIDQMINGDKTNFVKYPLPIEILNVIGGAVFSLIFILAAFHLCKEKQQKNNYVNKL